MEYLCQRQNHLKAQQQNAKTAREVKAFFDNNYPNSCVNIKAIELQARRMRALKQQCDADRIEIMCWESEFGAIV
jgi:hypothetical protein